MGRNLSNTARFKNLNGYTATSTADIKSTGVDMSGYDGVIFWLKVSTATTAHALHAEGGATQSTAVTDAYIDLANTNLLPTSNDEEFMIDVYKPSTRYVRAYFTPSATVELQFINCIQYGAHSQPVTNAESGVKAFELNANVTTGTV